MFKYAMFVVFVVMMVGCDREARSVSGATTVIKNVQIGADGMTAEQRNIGGRLDLEKPGSIKHLYVISAYSGDVLLYSTVKGKPTSAGKKLMPSDARPENSGSYYVLPNGWITNQLPDEDGTYGESRAHTYIYWFDVRGNYHQHYLDGGQIVHLSDVPMAWPKIILNLENVSVEKNR
jgi:hypothetical protein